MARQSKLSFPTSSISSENVFDLMHIDTWGPYGNPTYDGCRYFLIIIDNFSRGTWTYLLSAKSNAFPILKSFLAMVERQFHTKVKIIRSDNAFELGSRKSQIEFFISYGIQHQTTCIGSPQQNGVSGEKTQAFFRIFKSFDLSIILPISYWRDCVLTVTHLINKFPSKVLDFKTPY